MKQYIVDKLYEMTDEEQRAINEQAKVEQALYTSQNYFTVESEKFLNEQQLIKMRKHTRFVDFPIHNHNYIELNFVVKGSMEQIINDKVVQLKEGEIILLNQFISHEIKASKKDDLIVNFIIHPAYFDSIYSLLNQGNIIQSFVVDSRYEIADKGQYLLFHSAELEGVQQIMSTLLEEMHRSNEFSDAMIKLQTGILLVELMKNPQKIEQKLVNHNYASMVEIFNYVEKNYKNASLSILSKQMNQSYTAMSRFIKQETGLTFKQLIQEKRLRVACYLLSKTKISVTDIASKVGYDNFSYFYSLFKMKNQMTPKVYRTKFAKKDSK